MNGPVTPCVSGTFRLAGLDARYTIGREHVQEPALRLADTARPLSVDIETYGLGKLGWKIKAVTIGDAEHAVIMDPRDPYQHDLIGKCLALASAIVLHNSVFDVPSLVRNGLMRAEDIDKVWDTIIWSRMARPIDRQHNLLACAVTHLGAKNIKVLEKAFTSAGVGQGSGYEVFDLNRPIYVHGAALDVITTARLFPKLRTAAWNRITKGHPYVKWGVQGDEALRLLDREQRINRIFLRRQVKGLRVDLEYLDGFRAENAVERSKNMVILEDAGLDGSNSAKLVAMLDEKGLIPEDYPRTPKTKAPSGLANHLERIDHPLVAAFLMVKKADKIENDYLQKCVDLADENDRVHAATQIFGASATGRMSMSDPPFQQFSGAARGIIMADEGDEMTSIDWSQVEPVVAANIAKDVEVLAGYEAGTSDLYTDIAEFAQVPRKTAKVILLAQMYGEGMAKLAADLRITKDEAEALRDKVFSAMPKTGAFLGQLKNLAREHELVFTVSGRMLPIPQSFYDGKPSVAAHKGTNYVIQGSAYDVLAESLISIEEAGLGDAVYLALHDELVVSTSAAHDVRKIMETPPARLVEMAGRVPVLRTDMADMGDRWASV